MTDPRRPISLLTSAALGLGAALVLLLAGGGPAAAAPSRAGVNPSLLSRCFARDDSATGTVYSSADSQAVRQAVAAAVTSDTVRLAGTCDGVAAQGGTTQMVLIDKPLTLAGGYTTTDWVDTFPFTQPTTLDAQGLGRVITASADLTIAELTVQHGISFGGDGGGIFAGGNLTMIGAVNILSNTTGLTPTVAAGVSTSRLASSPTSGNGGGVFGLEGVRVHIGVGYLHHSEMRGNYADKGGAMVVFGAADLDYAQFINNTASSDGAGLVVGGPLNGTNLTFDSNSAPNGFGGGWLIFSTADLSYMTCINNRASLGACGETETGNPVNISLSAISGNISTFGAINFFQSVGYLHQDKFTGNVGNTAGGAVYGTDSYINIDDSIFIGNSAPEGANLAGAKFLSSPTDYTLELMTLINALPPASAAMTPGSANPLASSSVTTGSAISASGVNILVTDTIFSGYSLDFETSQSGTIAGDYNLFDQTPVISGTNITTGTHTLVGNPLFADALGHLSAGSPAINHGIDVGISTDLDGNPRPSGGGFDIGAYQFQFPKLFLPLLWR